MTHSLKTAAGESIPLGIHYGRNYGNYSNAKSYFNIVISLVFRCFYQGYSWRTFPKRCHIQIVVIKLFLDPTSHVANMTNKAYFVGTFLLLTIYLFRNPRVNLSRVGLFGRLALFATLLTLKSWKFSILYFRRLIFEIPLLNFSCVVNFSLVCQNIVSWRQK